MLLAIAGSVFGAMRDQELTFTSHALLERFLPEVGAPFPQHDRGVDRVGRAG